MSNIIRLSKTPMNRPTMRLKGDASILALFKDWLTALEAMNGQEDEIIDAQTEALVQMERAIAAVPATGRSGIAAKAAVLAHMLLPDRDPDREPTEEKFIDETVLRSLRDDAARFLPAATRLARGPNAAARVPEARAEGVIIDGDAPPPDGDAWLIEAGRRVVELLDLANELGGNPDDPRVDGALDLVFGLDEAIAMREPSSLAGAAVKLQRLLDPELGMGTTISALNLCSLRQVLRLLEANGAR